MYSDMDSIEYSHVEKLALDTHVLIWYSQGINLTESQINLIEKARQGRSLYISAISIWEIALLSNKGRIAFSISLDEWIKKILCLPGLNVIDLSVPILMQSCELTNYPHKDPADRLIIASTRFIDAHLMTFDQKIIDYATSGYLKVLTANS